MDEQRKGCFKYGCLGCVGCLVLPIVLILVLTLLSVAFRSEPRPESVHRSREITTPPRPGGAGMGAGEIPLTVEPGRIVLDVSRCRFELVAGPSGSSIEVTGNYDTAAFELKEDYEQVGETGWVYHLSLEPRGFFRFGGEGDRNRVQLVVPRDMPFALEGEIGMGESQLALGGLWLTQANLELGIGEHEISFEEPTPAPIGQFSLEGSIGELRVIGLGNASPSAVYLDHDIGEVDLDLSGDWKRDARVEAQCGIGECRVTVPDDESVAIVVEESGVSIGEQRIGEFERSAGTAPKATLRLAITGFIGELSVDR
jgi:hypothetical protein